MSAADADYRDTPSIIHGEIETDGTGQRLRYSQLSGLAKRDFLFDRGIRPTAYGTGRNGERPDVVLGLVQFSRSALQSIANHLLGQSLTRVSDELPEPKPKLFHTYGATAKIVFVPEGNAPYTGIFQDKAPGLARFSYAGPVAGVGVVPGLGLKFLIDGDHPSENLVAMRMLDRQQPILRYFSTRSHNSVFQHPFTNILPLPSLANLTMRVVNHRFETVVTPGYGLHQSVKHLARIRINGERVAPERAAAPYRLILRPTLAARAASDPTIDFRDDLARNIKAGMAIYDVLALAEADENAMRAKGMSGVEEMAGNAAKIGAIATQSEFIASKYGDYRLFFQHDARFIRDEFKPEPA